MSFPSITNNHEFFSDHYLEAIIANDLKGLRSDWEAREERGEHTPRKGVRALRIPFNKLKQDAEAATVGRGADPLQDLHDAVLTALGYEPHRQTIDTTRGEVVTVALPVVHATTLPTGLRLVALETTYAASCDEALGSDLELIEPLVLDGDAITEPAKAISLAFTVDDPPRHVLLLAGATLVLCARDSWPEGRFLAVDLDLALGRNDTKAKGELDTIAALFSRDALVPGETGEAIIDELGASSLKQAVGVSADLRDGVRRSVEDVANEIVTQRLARNLRVYNEPDVARRLARESLRFLYRILFLLYAEARPELGIVPSLAEGYRDGYGLDRLRELALTELTTEHANNGTHLHDSLDILFALVNDGYHHEFAQQQFTESGDAIDDTGLIFEPLHSELFGPNATPLLDSIRLRNEVVQAVLARLLLTQEKSGRERRFVSYATLGINQLGAVYEGLMAYTGFLADEDLHEVRKPGSEEKHGTWVVPVAKADDYDDDVFVTEIGEDGITRRVTHKKGSFVYRLSGRDRQRSASYYTPEVLTRCVVKHALEELLDQNGETTSADALLDLTICEPALGSGAFLNEAINQLSVEYLARKQNELEDTIDPDKYAGEFQKVKTHFALHQSYGVDLNATAVELAEVSLWLNAMHPGLRAPWFGLHLRRGNSLIGARRAVYATAQLAGKKWLKAVPEDRALATDELAPGEVHHFLLPADGWAAVRNAKDARQLRPDAVEALKKWHKGVTGALSKTDTARFAALALRVEVLWDLAVARLTLAERELRRPLGLYPADKPEEPAGLTTRAALEAALGDENTPHARLRLVMDAWCAMWFWPLEPAGEAMPPTAAQWLDALEGVLGIDPANRQETRPPQIDLFADLEELETREAELTRGLLMRTIREVREQHPWLVIVREIADREGFFHWELKFAPVFRRGGFALQVGNPPWVRPQWSGPLALADLDARTALLETTSTDLTEVRAEVLSNPDHARAYCRDLDSAISAATYLSDPIAFPQCVGLQTNLFQNFVEASWRHQMSAGVVGLLHPQRFLLSQGRNALRRETYRRLQRSWHFLNEEKLFDEVGNVTPFGVHIYGARKPWPHFLYCANLLVPGTVDQSLDHDGTGPVPGIKTVDGAWDHSGHMLRINTVERTFLSRALGLGGGSGDLLDAPLPQVHTRADFETLVSLAERSRAAQVRPRFSTGFQETGAQRDGLIMRETRVRHSWADVVLQGPHFNVSTPLFQAPNIPCRNHRDYYELDLASLPTDYIPTTNYTLTGAPADIRNAVDRPDHARASEWRLIHREMVQPGHERTLRAALIPPGALHVHSCVTTAVDALDDLVTLAGICSSLVADYVMKTAGVGHITGAEIGRLPWVESARVRAALALRVLVLNCLTREYEPLWDQCYRETFATDSWALVDNRSRPLERMRAWEHSTPLRRPFDRRRALVEVDALVALGSGLAPDQLSALYRVQFPVLRKYEHLARFDQGGTEVPRSVWRAYVLDEDAAGSEYVPPFTKPERETEMRQAYEVFATRFGSDIT